MTGADKINHLPVHKTIWINQEQNDLWNPKEVRKGIVLLPILREMFEKGVVKVYRNKITPEQQKALEEL